MKTEDLIKALSADNRETAMPLGRSWGLALGVAIVLAAAAFFSLLGLRPDFAAAAETVRFCFKFVVTIALALTAWRVGLALSRPEGVSSGGWWWLAIAPLLLLAAVVMEMMAVPDDQWMSRMVGSNMMVCMTFIPLIGLGPLAVFLAAIRYGAPTRPMLAGAIAGVLAGGVSATFYAAQCTDDSPLFVAAWYTLAIAVLALLGAVGGKVFARW